MRMIYLVLVHEGREQLDALVERLAPEGSSDKVIIHADRRSKLWRSLRDHPPADAERVHVIKNPVKVRWGHRSLQSAIGLLINRAIDFDFDYAHLVSGADWPVASRQEILRDLQSAQPPLCYIDAECGREEDRMQGFRIDARWLRPDPEREPLAFRLKPYIERLSHWLDARRRRLGDRSRPWGQWFKGETWWSLPKEALQVVAVELRKLNGSSRLVGTYICEEHVIPTIIATKFPDRVADYRRYIDWTNGGDSPRLLGRSDQQAIALSGAWFARKVSLAHDDFFLRLPPYS
ncbi:MAG: glycosyl transferase [Phenylobacterium sp.]|uniref:beta-1,6-N-acetylglucosaminyltransferase n=1 Tax=Phenylobacterium sp. TaxID=1871053 RepID=UPI0025CE4D40|nr:beta-1,6-N-acetylglucosaminyltransferase [Phenylobacterium sp.]MBA4011022.1 glycosyl transferase [Phenylobacterium sp.]